MISFGGDFGKAKEDFANVLAVLDGVSPKILEKLVPTFQEIGDHAAERATANAPILKGPLRADIHAEKVEVSADQISVRVVSALPYSLKQHEELTPAGPMQLGPVSRVQPMTPEGGVGGKFIERVVKFHLQRYQQLILKRFKEALGRTGRSKRSSR